MRFKRSKSIFAASALLAFSITGTHAQEDAVEAPVDPVVQLAQQFGVASSGLTGADLARTMLLEEGAAEKVEGLIADLSGTEFSKREKAVIGLIGISAPIDGAILSAREGADPGLELMLDRVLETRRSLRSSERTAYLFKLIAEAPLEGLAVPVARTAQVFDFDRDIELVRVAISAVVATAQAQDAEGLQLLANNNEETPSPVAIAGLTTIAVRSGKDLPAFEKGAEGLAVSYSLVSLGDGRAVTQLSKLLADESVTVRSEASSLLAKCAGHPEHYVSPYESPEVRQEKADWWVNWASSAGGKPEIKAITPHEGWKGVTMICAGGKGGSRMVEIGAAGVQTDIFSPGSGGISGTPNAVLKTTDGRTYIQCGSGPDACSVHLFDQSGRWLWSADGLAGTGGMLLTKAGNVQIPDTKKAVLNEYNWLGEKVAEIPVGGIVSGLQSLPGDRFLAVVPDLKAIVEYDSKGNKIWKMETMEGVTFARRLANGNHLLVHPGGATEFGSKGEEIWSAPASNKNVWSSILCAARRPGGNTYLGTDKGVIEVTPAGKVVKTVTGGRINSIEAR